MVDFHLGTLFIARPDLKKLKGKRKITNRPNKRPYRYKFVAYLHFTAVFRGGVFLEPFFFYDTRNK
ncbi:hypothetical protein EFB08_00525 [Rufibacter latericius]|uniref:Uncharacterized protein n=1 Tax=Rufibacter latericius TaxID=2487040 RepID=A0A3M9MZY7_9BACT|nr:hypothetical protein EFB08_00525 [Rufibacter latericius]